MSLPPDTAPSSVLSLVPIAFCPDETLEASRPSVTEKGDMTGKDTKSDMKSVPQTNICFLEKNYLELITSWKYKIDKLVRVCFCLIIHYYPMPAPLQMKGKKYVKYWEQQL